METKVYNIKMNKKITEEIKNNIIADYLNKPTSFKILERKYNLCNVTIGRILKDVPKWSLIKIHNPLLNENFFHSIDNEHKAYFLGLLISDGNIFTSSKNHASISITLKEEDKYILEAFRTDINANKKVCSDGRGCFQFAINSNQMAKDLQQYGVVPRKSFKTYLPMLNDLLMMRHLIRGIFDGDGSIQMKQTQNNNRFLHNISFCGTHQLMLDISNFVFNTLHLNQKPTVYDYKNKALSEIRIQSKNDMYLFGEWIYKDSSIYLKRKHDKYLQFKEHYKLC